VSRDFASATRARGPTKRLTSAAGWFEGTRAEVRARLAVLPLAPAQQRGRSASVVRASVAAASRSTGSGWPASAASSAATRAAAFGSGRRAPFARRVEQSPDGIRARPARAAGGRGTGRARAAARPRSTSSPGNGRPTGNQRVEAARQCVEVRARIDRSEAAVLGRHESGVPTSMPGWVMSVSAPRTRARPKSTTFTVPVR